MSVRSPDEIARLVLTALPAAPSYLLGLSGGGDSLALLKILATKVPLRALHVNHGLGDQAAEMQRAALKMANRLGVACECVSLENPPSSNIEEWAREKRYSALREHQLPGEVVLTAHHQDDQAESFLLAASRASGPAGLRGIVAVQEFGQGQLARPALHLSRIELQSVLEKGDLWVEDLANSDPKFDRSRLRTDVMPAIRHWKAEAPANFAKAAEQWAETYGHWSALLDAYADEISAGMPNVWRIDALLRLPDDVRAMLLRRLCQQAGAPRIPSALLAELPRQLVSGEEARVVLAWQNWSFRPHRKRLFLLPPLPEGFNENILLAGRDEYSWLGSSRVRLDVDPASCEDFLACHLCAGRMSATVPLRRGGISKTAQKLFQEYGVPYWVRPYWPQLLRGDELIALAEFRMTYPSEVQEFQWLQAPSWVQPWLDRVRARAEAESFR